MLCLSADVPEFKKKRPRTGGVTESNHLGFPIFWNQEPVMGLEMLDLPMLWKQVRGTTFLPHSLATLDFGRRDCCVCGYSSSSHYYRLRLRFTRTLPHGQVLPTSQEGILRDEYSLPTFSLFPLDFSLLLFHPTQKAGRDIRPT